jgi:hypothetical protein
VDITVTAREDGKERLYFVISSDGERGLFVNRPDKPSINIPNAAALDRIEDKIIAALEAIEREEDKWHRVKSGEVTFPDLAIRPRSTGT